MLLPLLPLLLLLMRMLMLLTVSRAPSVIPFMSKKHMPRERYQSLHPVKG
jgi:hypothetical protein